MLPLDAYTKKYGPDPKKYTSVYDNNDTFYLAGYYDPTVMQLKMEKNIPTTGEASSTVTLDEDEDDDGDDDSNENEINTTNND